MLDIIAAKIVASRFFQIVSESPYFGSMPPFAIARWIATGGGVKASVRTSPANSVSDDSMMLASNPVTKSSSASTVALLFDCDSWMFSAVSATMVITATPSTVATNFHWIDYSTTAVARLFQSLESFMSSSLRFAPAERRRRFPVGLHDIPDQNII